MKSIGFVILTWNSEKVIEKCIRSIGELKEVLPYIVVVDNGSSDKTVNILETLKDILPYKFDIVRYSKNIGTTISRNKGLEALKNYKVDYYCILDSDTEVSDAAFLELINEMELNDDYGLIGPKMVTSSGVVQMSARVFPTVLEKFCKAFPLNVVQNYGEKLEKLPGATQGDDTYLADYLMSACWLIKPEVIERVGMLDEKIFYAPEDAEYCIRVWKEGFQIAYCPKAVIIHEWQRLSKKKFFSKMNWEHVKGLVYMFAKHRYCLTTKKLKKSFKIVSN